MKAKRKRHDNKFKAQVGLEALKEIRSIQEIAQEYEVHPAQVSKWKKKLEEDVFTVFEQVNRACPKARLILCPSGFEG